MCKYHKVQDKFHHIYNCFHLKHRLQHKKDIMQLNYLYKLNMVFSIHYNFHYLNNIIHCNLHMIQQSHQCIYHNYHHCMFQKIHMNQEECLLNYNQLNMTNSLMLNYFSIHYKVMCKLSMFHYPDNIKHYNWRMIQMNYQHIQHNLYQNIILNIYMSLVLFLIKYNQ